jgi:type I restriction enzyme S subunit
MTERLVPLKEYVTVQGGFAFKSADFAQEGLKVVKIANIKPPSVDIADCDHVSNEVVRGLERFKLNRGDLLLAMTGATIGKVGRLDSDEPCYLNQRVARLIPHDQKHGALVKALIDSPEFRGQVESIAHGSAQPNISASYIESIYVRYVEPDLRSTISTAIKYFDDKIELNRKTNETLEQMARAIFKSWFIDFDPVHAKRQGKKPFGMDDATAALFPDSFEQSELGEIPRGWVISPLGSFVEVVSGTTPKTSEPTFWSPEEHAWATPKDLSGHEGLYLTNTERMISSAGLAEIGSGLLPPGSVLMSSRAPIGYVALVDMPTAINQGFAGIKVSSSGHRFYMESWCRLNLDVIKNHSNGSTFQEISKSSFKGLQLVAPDARVLEAFSRAVEPLYDLIRNNQLECQALKTTRDLLLPRLLSGELTVKEATA